MKIALLQKYKGRKILKRMFFSSFGVSIFCIIIACIVGFGWFRTITVKEGKTREQESLSNSMLVLDGYLTTMQDTLQLLNKNVYVKRLIISEDIEWNDNMSIAASMSISTVSINTRIHSIYIFGEEGILLKSSNSAYPIMDALNLRFTEHFRGLSMRKFNLMQYIDVYGVDRQIISMAVGERDGSGEFYKNGVMVSIDIGSIFEEVFSNALDTESYLLLDSDFTVLGVKSSQFTFSEDLSSDILAKSIKEDGQDRGILELKENGQSYLLSYINQKSEGYYLVHLYPYDTLTVPIYRMGAVVILIGIVLSILIFAISFMISLRVYHPIDEVVNSTKFLQNNKNTNLTDKERSSELSAVNQMITSMVQQLNQYNEKKEMNEVIHYLNKRGVNAELPVWVSENYESSDTKQNLIACCLRLCDAEDFINNNTEDAIMFQMQTICNMVESELKEFGDVMTVIMDHEFIACIIFFEEGCQVGGLQQRYSKLLELIYSLLSIKLDVGVSDTRDTITDLSQAYQNARAATNYRFLFGMNSIITEKQMQQCALSGNNYYDSKEIMDAVKTGNQESFVSKYQSLAVNLQKHSLQNANETLIALAVEMYQYRRMISRYTKELEVSDYEYIRKELEGFHYIEDVMTWFLDLYGEIMAAISRVQKSGSTDIVNKAISYLEDNYSDINLNAQFLADKYNITPSYFSRIFNEACGCAFPDYLSSLRMEKAKKLLADQPEKSIQIICEEVGYTSSSYFAAMFRKKYGITPSQFRKSEE